MIAFIKGSVVDYTNETVTIDHNGFGWEVYYPHCDRLSLQQDIFVYTYLHIAENDMRLFGFESQSEKDLFIRLLSVKGLGPKTAMGVLMKGKLDTLMKAIEGGDVTYLKSMPGIGPKAASQIVLDLKGKLIAVASSKPVVEENLSQNILDAMEGLKNLGYKTGEIQKAVHMMKEKEGLSVQEYIKIGLRTLMMNK